MSADALTLDPGKTVTIQNLETKEAAPFLISEVAQYKAQIIVYGVTQMHAIRVFRGTVLVKERPGCWAYIVAEDPRRVVELSVKLRGLPLAIIQGGTVGTLLQGQNFAPKEGVRAHPILNAGRIPGILGHQDGAGKVAMIQKAQRLVDVYWEWREKNHYGPLPRWVRVARNRS